MRESINLDVIVSSVSNEYRYQLGSSSSAVSSKRPSNAFFRARITSLCDQSSITVDGRSPTTSHSVTTTTRTYPIIIRHLSLCCERESALGDSKRGEFLVTLLLLDGSVSSDRLLLLESVRRNSLESETWDAGHPNR